MICVHYLACYSQHYFSEIHPREDTKLRCVHLLLSLKILLYKSTIFYLLSWPRWLFLFFFFCCYNKATMCILNTSYVHSKEIFFSTCIWNVISDFLSTDVFSFIRYLEICQPTGCISLADQQWIRTPNGPHPCHYPLLSGVSIVASLTAPGQPTSGILICIPLISSKLRCSHLVLVC